LIDRKAPKEGPKFWAMPWTVDKEICGLAVDKKTGEIYQLDDPSDGYDVEFTVTGKGLQKKYEQVQIARKSSPLHDDDEKANEWLDYVAKNPIPECLVYFDDEYIEKQLSGGVRQDDKKGDKRGKGPDPDDEALKRKEQERPAGRPQIGRGGAKADAGKGTDTTGDELTWDEIHELDDDMIEEVVKEKELDENEFADCNNVEELQDKLAELLGVKAPKADKKADGKKLSLKERLAAMKNK